MLSIDLFNSRYEKKLHEGAVDDAIAHLIEPLSRRAMDIRTQLRSRRIDPKQVAKLEKEYEELVQKRLDIILDRKTQTQEQQVPSKQDPFAYVKPESQGIGDVQDPKQKMAQLAQKAKKGPLANVGAGLKAFIKGEPEPMDEEQQAINPRALGVANFQRLLKANMGNIPTVSLEFIRPEENFKLDQKGLDLISDYYDGLENDQAKNYFIYRVLPSGDETLKVLKQLGWSPQQVQPPLPGIPTQGELPLQEKKKSNDNDLEAGDVKVARELQKLRAQYPAAKSDVEAVARAEIDSTERSQRQLAAIRGANEKQDALLKQLVDLDQEQGREISGLDKENNSLEQRLAQVQATNDRLQQAVGRMTGAKKTAAKPQKPVPQGSADIAQGGIVDVGATVASAPDTTSTDKSTTSPAMDYTAQQLGGFANQKPAATLKPAPILKRAAESRIKEHGGGIGPRKHWQSMMPETALNPQDPQGDYEAKRRALHDLSLNKDVDQAAVLQRRLDLDREARDKGITETVVDIKSGMARIYRRLAPKIERHRDSFLAGQLYDELENYAELHGAEREFKQMMNSARNRAHMEYDTNPGGFHNWFWFLPFEDNDVAEAISKKDLLGRLQKDLPKVTDPKNKDAKPVNWTGAGKDDYGYTGYQGHGMPTDKQERARIRADKKKGVAEGADDIKKKMSKLEALALAANRAGDDAKCKIYQQKIQSLKQKLSQSMAEGWSDQGNPTPYSVYIDGREWRAYNSDDHARAVAEKVRANLKKQGREQTVTIAPSKTKRVQEDFGMPGTTIPRKSLIQGYTVFWNPKTQVVSVTRGGDSEEAAIEQARVGTPSLKNFRQAADRLIDRIESDLNEAREIHTREDFIRERDRLLRMISQETNPANKQILKSAIRQLENRAENEGWITIQSRMVREDSDGGEAVEMAIMRRMLVAHTDLIIEFGLDKVVQAIEEVAYNVGDTDEIGSSDVSGWVHQVKQILGADA